MFDRRGTRDSLDERRLAYDPVGVTLSDGDWSADVRPTFRIREQTVTVGRGDTQWAAAARAVLTWGIKLRSGFVVEPSADQEGRASHIAFGDRFWLVATLPLWRVREPVEVVGVVDEPRRSGLAYGTLRGHPVSGEESFVVDRRDDGAIRLTLRSMTRPAEGLWKPAYPALLVAQRVYHRRYVRALG